METITVDPDSTAVTKPSAQIPEPAWQLMEIEDERGGLRVHAVIERRSNAEIVPPNALTLVVSQPEPGVWIADDPATGQFGEGDSAEEAIRDLISSLTEYLLVLRERRYQLSLGLKHHLAVVESMVTPDATSG